MWQYWVHVRIRATKSGRKLLGHGLRHDFEADLDTSLVPRVVRVAEIVQPNSIFSASIHDHSVFGAECAPEEAVQGQNCLRDGIIRTEVVFVPDLKAKTSIALHG
eukprot:498020_1